MAQYPEPRLATVSLPPVPFTLRGATPRLTASCHSRSAFTVAGESKAALLPSGPTGAPPPIHMNGYHVKFW